MLYEKNVMQDAALSCLTLSPPTRNTASRFPDAGKLSDQLLWDAFRRGDESAFSRIYTGYSVMLFHYGCKYSTDKELVRDCLQDLFLYLKKNRLGLGQTNSIKLYLFKAFRRRIIEYLKKSSNQVAVKEPSEGAVFGVESSIETVYINKQVKAEQLEKLNKAIKTLDRIEQEAIYYFYFQGLTYEQIAARFKFSHVSSARRVMYRSLRQLRTFFSYS